MKIGQTPQTQHKDNRFFYVNLNAVFHYGLSQDIEYSALCYTVGPCSLASLYIIVFICQSHTPNPPSQIPFPWQPQVCFLFHRYVHLLYFRFHIQVISYGICLSLTYIAQYDNLQVHPCSCKWHYFILFSGLYSIVCVSVYIYICVYIYIYTYMCVCVYIYIYIYIYIK